MNIDNLIDACHRTRTDPDYKNILEDRAMDRYIVLNILHTLSRDQGFSNIDHMLRHVNAIRPVTIVQEPKIDTGNRQRRTDNEQSR